MSDPLGDRPFPRGALLGAAALIGFAILATGVGRLTGAGATSPPAATALERRELRFEDRADGAVEVVAVGPERVIEVLPPGSDGFVRGVLRGLVRERRARGVGSGPAFDLVRWDDGRFTLEDTATGRVIELGAFGPTNAGAFARLLSAAGTDG